MNALAPAGLHTAPAGLLGQDDPPTRRSSASRPENQHCFLSDCKAPKRLQRFERDAKLRGGSSAALLRASGRDSTDCRGLQKASWQPLGSPCLHKETRRTSSPRREKSTSKNRHAFRKAHQNSLTHYNDVPFISFFIFILHIISHNPLDAPLRRLSRPRRPR